jgi:cell division protease FtsH
MAYADEPPAFLPNQIVQRQREFSEETAREIDLAVRDIVEGAWEKALGVLSKEKALLLRGAELLLQKETLTEAELAELRAGAALRAA